METKNNVCSSICGECKKSVGLCSWSARLIPVKNWTAKKVKRKSAYPMFRNGYKVIKCPLFEKETRG